MTLANASVYLEAFGHIAIAWIWLEQAIAAHGKASDFHDGKRQAARYFFHWELPRSMPSSTCWPASTARTLDMQDEWF